MPVEKPIICVVDDDATVLRALVHDLQQQYGRAFRILPAESGSAALKALRALRLCNASVALLLVDQRMPDMTGVAFLAEAMRLFPDAKRVLLAAYVDTEAAIEGINTVKLDYYLLKPWDPPEERLYPALRDLLDDWQATFRPPFAGVRIIGPRWSPKVHAIKDFLARSLIPYQWRDSEGDSEAYRLRTLAGLEHAQLPLLLFPDGTRLVQPTLQQIAEQLGLSTHADRPFYDLIIAGAGPAGLAAAVYAASEGLRTLLIDREAPGGQAGMSARIENYLGFPGGISGADLSRRAVAQASRFGVEILAPQEVIRLRMQDTYRIVTLADETELSCHALLIATGVSYRQLDIPGLARLTGAGVYYGAAQAEAVDHRGQDMIVVGGGNSAGQAALHLARYARTVTLVVRHTSLTESMSHYLIDQLAQTHNIRVHLHAEVVMAQGQQQLEAVTIADLTTGAQQTYLAAALFVFIGALPRTDWLPAFVARDDQGFLLTGVDLQAPNRRAHGWPLDRDPFVLETSVPGIFVAGDVRHGSIKRVASAVGEGAVAVHLIHEYLSTTRTRVD